MIVLTAGLLTQLGEAHYFSGLFGSIREIKGFQTIHYKEIESFFSRRMYAIPGQVELAILCTEMGGIRLIKQIMLSPQFLA